MNEPPSFASSFSCKTLQQPIALQDKEKLLTDLRKILNITNDQHFKFLEEVAEDQLVTRLREARGSNPAAEQPVPASYAMPPPRQNPNNTNRKSSRPSSAGLKITPSPTAGQRPSRSASSVCSPQILTLVSYFKHSCLHMAVFKQTFSEPCCCLERLSRNAGSLHD